jgi:hypothetical protein
MTRKKAGYSLLFLVFGLAISLLGCDSFQSRFVGTWSSEKQTLALSEDHRFIQKAGRTVMSGTWTADGRSLVLTPDQIDGKSTVGFVSDLYQQIPKNPKVTTAQLKTQEQQYLKVLQHLPMQLSEDRQTLTMYPDSPQAIDFHHRG